MGRLYPGGGFLLFVLTIFGAVVASKDIILTPGRVCFLTLVETSSISG